MLLKKLGEIVKNKKTEKFNQFFEKKMDYARLEDIIFLSSQYEGLVDYNDMISTHQMIYIDKKGVIQLISSGKGINGIFMNKYLDEEEILNNIEQLVNNKAILPLVYL